MHVYLNTGSTTTHTYLHTHLPEHIYLRACILYKAQLPTYASHLSIHAICIYKTYLFTSFSVFTQTYWYIHLYSQHIHILTYLRRYRPTTHAYLQTHVFTCLHAHMYLHACTRMIQHVSACNRHLLGTYLPNKHTYLQTLLHILYTHTGINLLTQLPSTRFHPLHLYYQIKVAATSC